MQELEDKIEMILDLNLPEGYSDDIIYQITLLFKSQVEENKRITKLNINLINQIEKLKTK